MSRSYDHLEAGLAHGYLNSREENELLVLAKAGDKDAMASLISHNEKLIYQQALRAYRSGITGSSELVDLQQLGRLGFMKAVEKYDASKGYRLSTYATWWIRQHITRFGVTEGSTFSISHHDNELRSKLVRCRVSMELDLMREVTIEEVAARTGISIKIAKNLLGMHYVSMDSGFDSKDTPNDGWVQIADPEMDTESTGVDLALVSQIKAIISQMPDAWQQVMSMRFPLDGGEPLPYRDIADILRVSHQRISEIEGQAIRLIKSRVAK